MPQNGQAQVRYGWLGGKQRSAEAQDGDILMGARLYSPALGRFLQIDPVPGGNASPYDYCTGDPVNCTDLDGNWGFSFKKILNVVAKVAEVASYIPGPIGSIAAGVSAVSYAAVGNWSKAAEMTCMVVAAAVGATVVAKAAISAARSVRAVKLSLAFTKTAKYNTNAANVRLYNKVGKIVQQHGFPGQASLKGPLWAVDRPNVYANRALQTVEKAQQVRSRFTKRELRTVRNYFNRLHKLSSAKGEFNPNAKARADLMQYYIKHKFKY
ncbi:RHS repeat-associated core domain-containing protein [Kitasatospora herbaricolor]|uniref:RHS repeat-associated protein n=1 Tax=Kitasatospora herbaricolor TaxID=68217 RepID=A0ABZ1WJA3_9ACTN|nr:RHS repeat-associated core domain-containing protein [Kitasatospora herbaricolor]